MLQNCCTISECQHFKSRETLSHTIHISTHPFHYAVKERTGSTATDSKHADEKQHKAQYLHQEKGTSLTRMTQRKLSPCFALREQLTKQMEERFFGKGLKYLQHKSQKRKG